MKVLGRSRGRGDRQMQRGQLRLRGARTALPRGFYRFKSHLEADAWLMKMFTR